MIDFVALALYSALMGSTPGPNNVMLTASGVNFGFVRTIPHMLGIAFGHIVQVMVTCLSLGEIFVRYPLTQRGLKVAGFCYLLYLSWRILGSSASSEKGVRGRPLRFHEAVLFQFVNPKAWVFVTTVAALFLPEGEEGLLRNTLLLSFAAGVIVIPCIALWAGFGQGLRRFLRNPVALRIFNAVIAAALVGTAIYLVI